MSAASPRKRIETLLRRIRKLQDEIYEIRAKCPHSWKVISQEKCGFDGYSTNYNTTYECELCLDRRMT